jgi:UDP-N-acetylmuramoyl-L-alanyl-D-glutamate--2,6-diaminopimelate ligase
MDEYFEAKKRLFTTSLDESGIGIINTDDVYGERLYNELKNRRNIYSFGMEKSANFAIKNINLNISGASFELSLPEQNNGIKINSSLCGKFNVYNTAAAVAAAFMLGVPPETISRALKNAPQVPGRMEKCLDSPLVFVDYAHTDDALENVLSTVSGILGERKLTVIFGCGGDRDKSKRPRMGKAAAKFADRIIVTSDNPRTENPEAIIQDIIAGIPDSANFAVFPDRKYAIEETLRNSQPDDVIVIAGKGHENYQEINGVKIHFDDRETVRASVVINQD